MSAGDLNALRRRVGAACAQGDDRGSRVACLQLLAVAPGDSLAHYVLANLDSDVARHRDAVAHSLAAAVHAAAHGPAHQVSVGTQLIALGEYGAAFRVISAIRRDDPSAAPSLSAVARQFGILEAHAQALSWLEFALARNPSDEGLHYRVGNARKFLGDLDGAAACYEHCIRLKPAFAFAHWSLAYLGNRYNCVGNVDRIRAALARSPSELERIILNYALFKELDSAGQLDEAWGALSRASADKSRAVRYDGASERRMFGDIAAAYRPAPADHHDDGPIPIFILGMPRTGTTLVERVMGNTEAVTSLGELNDFRMQVKWSTDHYCPGFLDAETVARIPRIDHTELGGRYLDHVAWRLSGQAAFTDKNPGNFVLAGTILSALPQARIISVRRDPMDSCFSNLKELFAGGIYPYSYTFAGLAAHYRNYDTLMRQWEEAFPGRILTVHYEDLVSNPAVQAEAIMRFCNLQYAPSQLRIEASPHAVSTASSAQVREPIHARNLGSWRRYARQLAPLADALDA